MQPSWSWFVFFDNETWSVVDERDLDVSIWLLIVVDDLGKDLYPKEFNSYPANEERRRCRPETSSSSKRDDRGEKMYGKSGWSSVWL